MPKHTLLLCTAAVAAVVAASGATARRTPPAHGFSARVTNPWFPLAPGTRFEYAGVKDGRRGRDVMTVTGRTKTIMGAPCAVVDDRLYLSGRLAERTTDWYTQDAQGNVWYFGEQTAELDAQGRVRSTEGSWQAGVNGAQPGIFMPARPKVGASYRQEYYRGHAEDHFKVAALFGSPGRSTLLTSEWTPLEPGVLDHKVYVKGVGQIVEETATGGDERFVLVSLRRHA